MTNYKNKSKIMAGLLIGLFTLGAVFLTPIATTYAAEPSTTPTPPGQTDQTTPPTDSTPTPPTGGSGHSGHNH